jgi:hypothetical protein
LRLRQADLATVEQTIYRNGALRILPDSNCRTLIRRSKRNVAPSPPFSYESAMLVLLLAILLPGDIRRNMLMMDRPIFQRVGWREPEGLGLVLDTTTDQGTYLPAPKKKQQSSDDMTAERKIQIKVHPPTVGCCLPNRLLRSSHTLIGRTIRRIP